MSTRLYALEHQVQFIFEKRTELYIGYYSGVSQKKIVHGAKSTLTKRALPGLRKCGA
jgi:hypothetical protein